MGRTIQQWFKTDQNGTTVTSVLTVTLSARTTGTRMMKDYDVQYTAFSQCHPESLALS